MYMGMLESAYGSDAFRLILARMPNEPARQFMMLRLLPQCLGDRSTTFAVC